MQLGLRRNEKIYINGAVLRADRKVCIEILNKANFLLESHVMQADDAITPMRQLYFIVQMMLMSPDDVGPPRRLLLQALPTMLNACTRSEIVEALGLVAHLVNEKRYFDALKCIREVFHLEPLDV